MTLYERSSILWVICDDLMNCVKNRHHCISIEVLCWVLLPTWQITNEVPQSIAPCVNRQADIEELL